MASRKTNKSGGAPVEGDAAPVADPRFSRVHTDPRFKRPAKSKERVAIDSRFQQAFVDPRFTEVGAAVDARGRKVEKGSGRRDLAKLYQLDEDEIPKAADDGSAALQAKLDRMNALARGEVSGESSSDESSADSSDDEDTQQAEEAAAQQASGPVVATRRIALVNMDWQHVRAVDIFAVLSSFAPTNGSVKDVTVYPSKFGLERMAQEAALGPKGIWRAPSQQEKHTILSKKGVHADQDEVYLEDVEAPDSEAEDEAWREASYDPDKLRQYELDKLRYYYAIITCDSVATAKAIASQCNGQEFEQTGNTLDMEYVPDDMVLENTPRDSAQSVPDGYTPPEFRSRVLGSTKVDCTWDEPDVERVKVLAWERQPRGDVNDDDFKAYIASSSDSEAEEAPEDSKAAKAARKAKGKQLRAKYKALLGDIDAELDTVDKGEEGMQITFMPGLGEEILKKKEQRELEASETPFEAYQRKRKEKRKARKNAAKAGADIREEEEEAAAVVTGRAAGKPTKSKTTKKSADADGDGFFANLDEGPDGVDAEDDGDRNDAAAGAPSVLHGRTGKSKSDKAAKEAARAAKEREAAELELLTMGKDDSDDGYDIRDMLNATKAKSKRKAKKSKDNATDDFKIDVTDPRFVAMHEDPKFSVDPTHASYKDTVGMRDLMAERQRRRREKLDRRELLAAAPAGAVAAADAAESTAAEKRQISSLVASLKSKLPNKKPRTAA